MPPRGRRGGVLPGLLARAIFGNTDGFERALTLATQAVRVVDAIGIVLAAAHEAPGASARSALRARPRWAR